MTARELLASPQVAPSILSADFGRLGDQVATVMDAGARVIHVDVMDGHFVPPITIGDLIVGALADQVHDAGGILDVHLMIERPERQVDAFAKAGADVITVHQEATPNVHYAVNAVREAGCLAGLAINPATPAETVAEVAGDVDVLLCMTVNPGWGGQAFIPHSTEKVERLRELVPGDVAIEVDGGIDSASAPRCAAAGARLFVAGSAVFGADDPGRAYQEIERSVSG
ncbi:MAG TPA: ribulose-phosphate 3-epimerase [Thermoleophilaceae bacterium]|nr:ribulose-phosphate 3-epimerase [Thermoleophilaceae bacterium]